jgi:hypothetical protein
MGTVNAYTGRMRRRTGLALLAPVLLVAALVAACSADGAGKTSSAAAGSAASRDSAQSVPGKPGATTGAPGSSAGSPGDLARQGALGDRRIARTAALSVQVKDIARAAAAVRAAAAAVQGIVVSEQMGGVGDPRPVPLAGSGFGGFGTLTLSVPAAQLDATLDQLARVGTVLSRSTSSQDVTDQYVDTESRVKSMTASLDRVRSLMARATTIGQVVTLESELSRREADLESLQAQLAELKGSVERSTVTVSLSTPVAAAAPGDTGFLAGLRGGWHAFKASATAVLTFFGAVLPFAVLVALLGWPALWWRRRRQAATVTASPAPAAPGAP